MGFRRVVKVFIPTKLFRAVEPIGHGIEAGLVQILHGFPAKKLNIIGVTGTDGKTTTCMLIAQMLRHSGKKVAMITTVSVDYADGKGPQPSPTHMTTASAAQLAKMFKKIAVNKPDWVVLETSSHALAQHRILGIPYSIAVLTNLSHEHLDYHRTFERYREAKQRLFTLANRNTRGLRMGIVNADDPSAKYFTADIKNSITYGLKEGDLRAKHVQLSATESRFSVKVGEKEVWIRTNLPGEFNVYNSLAATAVGVAIGLTKTQIEEGIESLKEVPGRMYRLEASKHYNVIVDYAVTPAALEQVLKAAQEITPHGQVHIVFGATGDRDRSKRPVMGEIVAKLADRIYLTDDETYKEDPAKIRAAVMKGIEKAEGTKKTQEFNDRGDAIQAALTAAKRGDTVLITGLGHQKDRNMGGKLIPWNDAEIASKYLENK